MIIVKKNHPRIIFLLLLGFDNHLVLSGISENTHHILSVERIIAKSAESYLSFSLRFRCEACTERYQQQQLRKKDEIDGNNIVNLEEEEDLSLPILFDEQSSPPWEDVQEEEENANVDEDCTCRLITPLQFKV